MKASTKFKTKGISLTLLIGSLFLNSCKDDFLNLEPKGRSIAEITEDFDLLLNSTQPLIFLNSIAYLGDEVVALDPYYSGAPLFNQRFFSYEDEIYLPDQEAFEFLNLSNGLYLYNKIINEVMASQGGTDQQKRSIRAEALVGRAWANFMMINLYTKPYVRATAANDPGIIMLREANVNAGNFTRGKLQEAYDWVINDLETALPDLPEQTSGRMRAGKITAEALLGKIYFMMARYDEALPLLSSSIARVPNEKIPLGLYDFAKELRSGGAFSPINPLFGPNRNMIQNIDRETIFLRFNRNGDYWITSNIILSKETMALLSAGDRRRAFTNRTIVTMDVLRDGMARAFGKYTQNNGLNLSEIYLQLAECQARAGDLAAAVQTIEALRVKRMPEAEAKVPATIAADRSALVRFILDEGIRETFMTGYRWFEMRRLSVDDEFKDHVKMEHPVYDRAGKIVKTFTLRPERFTLRYPQYIKNTNPGLEQNP